MRWGSKVIAVSPIDSGRHELTFSDGSTVTTNLLVGADGAWSRVRPLIVEVRPAYVGMVIIETNLFDVDTRHKASASAVGGGSMLALAPGQGIFAWRGPKGVLYTYAVLKKPREWIDSIDFTDTATAFARVAEEFDGWAPELMALITDGETAPVPRPIHSLPVTHRWDRVAGVTLLGDAAHLTTPNGEGANLAMFDGAELGEAIAANPGDVEAALIVYETDLFLRGELAAAAGDESLLDEMLGPNSPQSLVDFLTSHQPAP